MPLEVHSVTDSELKTVLIVINHPPYPSTHCNTCLGTYLYFVGALCGTGLNLLKSFVTMSRVAHFIAYVDTQGELRQPKLTQLESREMIWRERGREREKKKEIKVNGPGKQ